MFLGTTQNFSFNKKIPLSLWTVLLCGVLFFVAVPQKVFGATLNLSPASSAVTVGSTFTVTILLDTSGQPTYGVDVYSLHFNPAVLQVVDADGSTLGVQISSGSLMANNQYNTVNNATGVIQFSQTPSTSAANFVGSGTLATITFQAIAAGTSAVSFDFTPGSTVDTNVASLYSDLLTSVTNGSYTVSNGTDTTAPSIPTALSATAISSSAINLSWTPSTDPTVSGQNTSGLSGYKIVRGGVQVGTSATNSYSDTGLNPSTAYSYVVSAYDGAGNNSSQSSAANATTQAPLDTTPPVLSSITASTITTSSATITWITNESSDSQVDYGLTTAYGASSVLNSSLVTSHSVALSSLTANTVYHYRVKSRDAAGNLSASPDATFTTPAPAAPIISGISASSIGPTSATINWNTSAVTNGQVKYGTTATYGTVSALVNTAPQTTSHSVSLSGLTAGTTYHYQVVSVDAFNSTVSSVDQTFTTTSNPDSTAPTVTITAPSNGQNVSGTVNIAVSASDPLISGQVNSGVFSVTALIDGVLFATSSTANLSTFIDTTTLTNAVHTITATAKDNAGNIGNSSSVSMTVFNLSTATRYPRKIKISALEGLSAVPISTQMTATVISPINQSVLSSQPLNPDVSGNYTVNFQSTFPQTTSVRVKVNGYLPRLLTNIDTTVNSVSTISAPLLYAGDFNNDSIINTLDYSMLNSHWNQNFAATDMNADGLVNSIDFAILKNNWNKVGE